MTACTFSHLTFFVFFKGCWRDWQSGTGTGNALRGHSNCVCLHVVLVARNCAHFFGDSGSYEFAHYKTLYPRHAWRFQKENWPDNQRQTCKFILILFLTVSSTHAVLKFLSLPNFCQKRKMYFRSMETSREIVEEIDNPEPEPEMPSEATSGPTGSGLDVQGMQESFRKRSDQISRGRPVTFFFLFWPQASLSSRSWRPFQVPYQYWVETSRPEQLRFKV